MYLVSLESSLKMQENDVNFMLISWILFELSKFEIEKYMSVRFCRMSVPGTEVRNEPPTLSDLNENNGVHSGIPEHKVLRI